MRTWKILLPVVLLLLGSCKKQPTEQSPPPEPADFFPLNVGNTWTYRSETHYDVSSQMIVGDQSRWGNQIRITGERVWRITEARTFSDRTEYAAEESFDGMKSWTWTGSPPGSDTTRLTNVLGSFTLIWWNTDTLTVQRDIGFDSVRFVSLAPFLKRNSLNVPGDSLLVQVPTFTTMPGQSSQRLIAGKGLDSYVTVWGRVWAWGTQSESLVSFELH